MARRRWIYRDGVAIEVTQDYVPLSKNGDALLWNDRSYQDMNDPRFSSRQQHRQYMADRGLTTADDFTDTWKQTEKARTAELQGIDPSRKRDLIQNLQRLQNGNRR